MPYKKFIKDVAVIGFTQILINLSSFLILPLITKILGVYIYGIWAQLSVTIVLLTGLTSLALYMAFIRFFSSKTDKKEISKGFFSIFFFLVIFSILIYITLFIFSEPISLLLFNTKIYVVLFQISTFLIVLNPLYTFVLYYFRTYRQMLFYSGLSFFAPLCQLIVTIILLMFFKYGLYGVVFSAIISYFISILIALGIIIKQVGLSRPSFLKMPIYLRFSLPLVSNNLIYWISSSSDRYIIGLFLGVNSVGVYSAAYVIGQLISFFVLPLQMILFPQLTTLYDNGKIEEVKKYLSYSIKFFLLIAIPSVLGLSVVSKQILILITTTEFTNGSYVIPLIASSTIFAGLFQIIINIIFLYKKTKYVFYIQGTSALLNIFLNFVLVPIIGIIGAAISSLFSFIIMNTLAYIASKKYLRFKIDNTYILKIIVCSILMAIIVFLLKDQISLITQILIGIVSYLVFCYILRIFNKKEISFLKKLLKFSKNTD